MLEHYADLPDERQKFEDWCRDIDPCDDTNLYERLKTTGITENPHKHRFHIYLRRRYPGSTRLEHVKKWDNALPGIEEIGSTFGAGTAVIDFEVLYGRYNRKKKCSKRTVIRFGDNYEEKKRQADIKRIWG